MKTTIEYLDAAKKALSVDSDYEMARKLGIIKQAMSNYRTGRRTIDDYAAMKIAEALKIDEREVIAAANYEREKDEKRKDYWGKIFQRYAAAGLVITILCPGIIELEATKTVYTPDYARCHV